MPKVGDIIRAEDFKTNGGFIGQIIEFPSNLIPSNTLLCDGSELSRETYSELFNVIGTIYGEGDGSTTFALPDFRGYFLRGANGTNSAAMGTAQGDAIREITGQFAATSFSQLAVAHVGGAFTCKQPALTQSSSDGSTVGTGLYWFNASNVVPTAAEVRPINYAVNICIIYE